MTLTKKSLGQHWLRDPALLQYIQEVTSLQCGDTLIEIGPGDGALTASLAKVCTQAQCEHVCLIEKDDALVNRLRQKFPTYQILHQDILTVDIQQLYSGRPLVIYGNLPYNISVSIIKKLCRYTQLIKDMTFLVQKEVGERLGATQGKHYGPLSIFVQLYCEVQVLREVPPTSFRPSPKVHSVLIKLVPKSPSWVPRIFNLVLFQQALHTAFGQRRKKLSNTLGKYYKLPETVTALRPEQISLGAWLTLINNLEVL